MDDIGWLGLTEDEIDLIYTAASYGSVVHPIDETRERWQGIVRTIDQYRVGDWRHPSEQEEGQ